GSASKAARQGCSTFFTTTVQATLVESLNGCADSTRPVRNSAVPDAPCPTRVRVLSTSGGGENPASEQARPAAGAITIGCSSAFLMTENRLAPLPPADSSRSSDSGVTTMAATATATATEIEADLENSAATIGSPAEPTLGPDAVSAISALSRRSLPKPARSTR